VTVTPTFYGFHEDGGSLLSSIYSDAGGWIEDRGGVAWAGEFPADAIIIHEDSAAQVGVGSLVWSDGADTIYCWDVVGDVLYSYTATVGALVSSAYYHAGKLYWSEIPAAPTVTTTILYLRRADCDLTGAETVSTVELETSEDATWDSLTAAINSVALLIAATFTAESSGGRGSRMPLSGSSGTTSGEGAGSPGSALFIAGVSDGDGKSLLPSGGEMLALEDAVYPSEEPRWPTTASWVVASGLPANVDSRTEDGKALLYGIDAEDEAEPRVAIVAAATDTSGAPDSRVVVENHPTVGAPPDILFLMEAAA
jgi:hypothetical protein